MLLVEKPLDGVAVVTLNRPEAMNALSKALRAALREALIELDRDDSVRVIVLTGAGERAFTAGLHGGAALGHHLRRDGGVVDRRALVLQLQALAQAERIAVVDHRLVGHQHVGLDGGHL